MRVILTEWYLSNIDKIFEKIFEGVFFSEFANKNAAALLKNDILHSYWPTILLKVWVIAYYI